MPRHRLACCAIYRDEAPYLREWLRFHVAAGVEHFFLYDNASRDDGRAVIADTLSPKQYTLVDWPAAGAQREAYQHALDTFGPSCRWLAFIDLDEFLFCPNGVDLRVALEAFTEVPGVAVNGLLFGTSGHATRPDGDVTQHYCWRAKETTAYPFRERLRRADADPTALTSYYPMSAHLKCVVDPSRVVRCETPHRFTARDGAPLVTEEHRPVSGNYSEHVSFMKFRLHHYWSRSTQEFRAKLARGRVSGRPHYDEAVAFEVEALMHEVHDVTLRHGAGLSTVPLLADYLGEHEGRSPKYPGRAVRYWSEAERGPFEVTTRRGRLEFATGAAVTTELDARGRHALYVLDPAGRLFVHPGERGLVHHSSFVDGGPVAGAGRIRVEDGVVRALDSESGHYRVPPTVATQVLDWLAARGVSLGGVAVTWL